jgi:NADP-dependent 3-hydroxy acid dehydrogenase YdfG
MSRNIEGQVVVSATVVLGARRADRLQSLAEELTSRGG